jgi:hypothetical protein
MMNAEQRQRRGAEMTTEMTQEHDRRFFWIFWI